MPRAYDFGYGTIESSLLLPMRFFVFWREIGLAMVMLRSNTSMRRACVALISLVAVTAGTWANIPGGGTGTGPNVTLVDNGTTVTIANGIVSILCTKSGATIDQINYTYNNGSGPQTINLLSGGNNGGQLYWELGGFGGGTFAYSVTADPASNGGNYAEISLVSSSASSGTMEVRFSMLRGSTGFYVTPIWSHR